MQESNSITEDVTGVPSAETVEVGLQDQISDILPSTDVEDIVPALAEDVEPSV